MSSIIRLRSGLTVLVSLMESSFLIEAVNTSILRTGALHCYHYYILSTGSRPLGSCSRAAGWSAATSCYGPKRTHAAHQDLRYSITSPAQPHRDLFRRCRAVRLIVLGFTASPDWSQRQRS